MTPSFTHSLDECIETLGTLRTLEPVLNEAAEAVLNSLLAGGKLLCCGNGGSAADSAHLATEFTCRFSADRRPYPAIALASDAGLLTAIANDYAFKDVFARQVWAYGKEGDVLLAFSTSGKSRNILSAIEEARRRKVVSIAFLGRDGGFTAGAADLELIVPCKVTARIQEAHKFLIHALCEAVEAGLPKE
jgi:D-sedoheptulose 7-phosphate isomerase